MSGEYTWKFQDGLSLWHWHLSYRDTVYYHISMRPWPPISHPYQLYEFNDLGEPVTLGHYDTLEDAQAEVDRRMSELLNERQS